MGQLTRTLMKASCWNTWGGRVRPSETGRNTLTFRRGRTSRHMIMWSMLRPLHSGAKNVRWKATVSVLIKSNMDLLKKFQFWYLLYTCRNVCLMVALPGGITLKPATVGQKHDLCIKSTGWKWTAQIRTTTKYRRTPLNSYQLLHTDIFNIYPAVSRNRLFQCRPGEMYDVETDESMCILPRPQ